MTTNVTFLSIVHILELREEEARRCHCVLVDSPRSDCYRRPNVQRARRSAHLLAACCAIFGVRRIWRNGCPRRHGEVYMPRIRRGI